MSNLPNTCNNTRRECVQAASILPQSTDTNHPRANEETGTQFVKPVKQQNIKLRWPATVSSVPWLCVRNANLNMIVATRIMPRSESQPLPSPLCFVQNMTNMWKLSALTVAELCVVHVPLVNMMTTTSGTYALT